MKIYNVLCFYLQNWKLEKEVIISEICEACEVEAKLDWFLDMDFDNPITLNDCKGEVWKHEGKKYLEYEKEHEGKSLFMRVTEYIIL